MQENYIVDVREPDEVALGMIPSAVNIPLADLGNTLTLNPVAFKAKFGFEKPQKDQEIVVYCRSGKRSATSADIMKRHGYTKYVFLTLFRNKGLKKDLQRLQLWRLLA